MFSVAEVGANAGEIRILTAADREMVASYAISIRVNLHPQHVIPFARSHSVNTIMMSTVSFSCRLFGLLTSLTLLL